MPRLTPLDLDHLDPEQQRAADAIVASPRGRVGGPFPAWLRHPPLADRARALGDWCRFESPLPRDVAELAILAVVARWRVQPEFHAHTLAAREAGVPEDAIEAIRTGATPDLADERLAATHALVREYLETTAVSEATYQRALAALGEEGLVDLVATAGYYAFVAMTMNVFEVPLPPGVEPPLP